MKVHFQVVVVVWLIGHAGPHRGVWPTSFGGGVVFFIYIPHHSRQVSQFDLISTSFFILLKNFILMDDSTRFNPTHFPWFIYPLPLLNEIFSKVNFFNGSCLFFKRVRDVTLLRGRILNKKRSTRKT